MPDSFTRRSFLLTPSLLAVRSARAASKPWDVGSRKQVFLDRRFIESANRVELVVNRPRVTGEKLIQGDRPWESFFLGGYQSVIQEDDRIRLWYECTDLKKDFGYIAYAYSTDGGATWTKPDLGVIEHGGSEKNNLVIKDVHGTHVFPNRPDAPSDERYLMYAGNPNQGYASPDGYRWRPVGTEPFLDKSANPHMTLDSQNVVFWDSRIEKYVTLARFNVPTTRGTASFNRRFGRAESPIFGDFGKFEIVLQRDENDPEDFDFYTTAAIPYRYAADAYYMFPAAYHHAPPPPRNDGPLDIQFAASRDGIRWLRPDRRPIIRRGFDGAWNDGTMYAGWGLSRHSDELSLYYKANDVTHGAYREREYVGGIISRAVYRLDGFMSVDAPFGGGDFVTPALIFDGRHLELNVDCSAGGWVQIEVLDQNGRAIEGLSRREADRVTGNAVAKVVTWGGKRRLSSLRRTPVKLRFLMRDAKLYAFQFPAEA